MREPLKFELHGNEDNPKYLRLYECEHLTDGTMPLASEYNIVHVGDHSSISLCKHCAQHMVGMVTRQLIADSIRRTSIEEIRKLLALGRVANTEQHDDETQELQEVES